MEFDIADKLDLEWHSIFQKHLKTFSCQNEDQTYTFDEVLIKLFCPDPEKDEEVKYEDKEICEKCLIDALNLLSRRPGFPRQTQIQLLLKITKYTCKDESCFINLKTSNVIQNVIIIAHPSRDIDTKIMYMEFLQAFLEHQSGVNWMMDTRFWIEIFNMTVNYHNADDRMTKIGYEILRVLLEKVVEMDRNDNEDIIKFMAGPILNPTQQTEILEPENSHMLPGIKGHLTCFVKILENLLKNYSASVLQYFMDFKVGVISDQISEKCSDVDLCLIFDRISLLLSFFGLTELFDGIKTVMEDPLELSGFLRIIEREVKKENFTVVLDIYYYVLKYIKYIYDKLPKYFFEEDGEEIGAECQLVALQLEPMLLEWQRIDSATDILKLAKCQSDILENSHPFKIFKKLGYKTFPICNQVKRNLPKRSFDICTRAVENLVRSKPYYTKESVCSILEALVYSLEAPLRYLQSKKYEQVTVVDDHQLYILALLEATLAFMDYNFSWSDSVKTLDLLYIIIEGSSSYPWIEAIILDSLILLKQLIERRCSPSMTLLIDTAEGLRNIGPLLYKTCFTSEWKVRNAVLEVVHEITRRANQGFTSFQTILFNASLPSLISTMAVNDENLRVRATALKCLQQMVLLEDIDDIVPKDTLIFKVLDIIKSKIDPMITTEAVRLMSILYNNEEYLSREVKTRMYKCLEQLAFSNDNSVPVQTEIVIFFGQVTKRSLTDEGWLDCLFPTVTFSKKRIVSLTNKEVGKRCYKVLCELSQIGCLDVLAQFYRTVQANNQENLNQIVINCLRRLHFSFSTHKITPESVSFKEDGLDLSIANVEYFQAQQESTDILQEIIRDTMMRMEPDDMGYVDNEIQDIFAMLDPNPKIVPCTEDDFATEIKRRITPSEFVELVYKTYNKLVEEDPLLPKTPMKDCDVYLRAIFVDRHD